jgi:hypothetical protein
MIRANSRATGSKHPYARMAIVTHNNHPKANSNTHTPPLAVASVCVDQISCWYGIDVRDGSIASQPWLRKDGVANLLRRIGREAEQD